MGDNLFKVETKHIIDGSDFINAISEYHNIEFNDACKIYSKFLLDNCIDYSVVMFNKSDKIDECLVSVVIEKIYSVNEISCFYLVVED